MDGNGTASTPFNNGFDSSHIAFGYVLRIDPEPLQNRTLADQIGCYKKLGNGWRRFIPSRRRIFTTLLSRRMHHGVGGRREEYVARGAKICSLL